MTPSGPLPAPYGKLGMQSLPSVYTGGATEPAVQDKWQWAGEPRSLR